ncbi:hypothetical protein B0H12DRAFT_1178916 [Mycena haematopus]|nr:hypothetical protein B0H12DRAFT_1178916 [Mycena haematopus]
MLPRLPHSFSQLPYSPWSLPAMPHGMDPTDYRAFYPYTPNEVKHRKRTTSAQLKVLEGIFKRDTKPNAALRTELASQLNMTARGVQVWFQNRRAKEKTKAAKGAKASSKDGDSPSPRSSEDPDESSPNELPLPGLSTSESPSPTATEPPQLHVVTDSGASSWQGSPVVETPEDPPFDLPSLHMVQSRRGSLPINALSYGAGPLVDPLDPLARRRSVDASLVRLAANPYAGIARAKNMATQRLSHGRRNQYIPRPGMPHRATATFPQHTRHASMDSRGYRIPPSPSPSPLSPYHAVRASLPDQQLYPVTARALAAPIPGPLPSPGFSFGMANASPGSDRNSPIDFDGFSFPPASDADTDDSSASYPMSRFGSIASESSATSAYFSDIGSTGEAPDYRSGRRESCPTGFLNLMSGLDVNVGGQRRASLAEGLLGNYSSHSLDGSDRDGAAGYPSPSSTVSPGDSPRTNSNGNPGSELHYALRSADTNTFFTASTNENYPHSVPATSDEFGDKFNYEYGMPYAHGAEGNYSEATAYGDNADAGYGHGGMDFSSSEQQQQPYYESSHPSADTAFTYS